MDRQQVAFLVLASTGPDDARRSTIAVLDELGPVGSAWLAPYGDAVVSLGATG